MWISIIIFWLSLQQVELLVCFRKNDGRYCEREDILRQSSPSIEECCRFGTAYSTGPEDWETSTIICRECTSNPINGQWSQWAEWTHCSASCGTGTQTRSRQCNDPPPANGGHNCPRRGIYETKKCIFQECDLSTSHSDENFYLIRKTRSSTKKDMSSLLTEISTESAKHALYKTNSDETNYHPLPSWSEWSDYSDCNNTCGPGVQTRYRYCKYDITNNGCRGNRTSQIKCFGPCIGAVINVQEVKTDIVAEDDDPTLFWAILYYIWSSAVILLAIAVIIIILITCCKSYNKSRWFSPLKLEEAKLLKDNSQPEKDDPTYKSTANLSLRPANPPSSDADGYEIPTNRGVKSKVKQLDDDF